MFPKGVPQIPVCVLVRRVGAMLGWVCVFPRRPYEAVALRGEAVAQTPGELAGSFLRVGSERGHLLRRTQRVSRSVVPHDSPGVYVREREAAFPRWLCATASEGEASVSRRARGTLAARPRRKPGGERTRP